MGIHRFAYGGLEANGNWAEMVYFHAAPGSPAWSQVVGRDRLNAPKDGRFDFFSRELFAILADHTATPAASQAFGNGRPFAIAARKGTEKSAAASACAWKYQKNSTWAREPHCRRISR